MSLYGHLSIPVPVLAYCAMHQARPAIPEEEYEKTMRELHGRIAGESASIAGGYRAFLEDAMGRETETLHATLSQFLETPLSRDEEEIRRVLHESASRLCGRIQPARRYGLKQSSEGKFVFPAFGNAASMDLLRRGREYLESLGFAGGEGKARVYESEFIVEGAENLDILEHIVRDRLGIYATTHGRHIKEFNAYSYTAFNLVYQKGELSAGQTEAALFFSKPDVKYAPFRNGLESVFARLSTDVKIAGIAVWQRKLGLGSGVEFVARMRFRNIGDINGAIEWLWANNEKPFVHEALVAGGRLTVKEMLLS